jgi:protein-disulfide isomerase
MIANNTGRLARRTGMHGNAPARTIAAALAFAALLGAGCDEIIQTPSGARPGAAPPPAPPRPVERVAPTPSAAPRQPQVVAPSIVDIHKIPLGDSPARGGALPKVSIVVFSEFQCPFCARVEPTLAQILKTYGEDVRIHWRHLPLPFHDKAVPAALAAEAAGEQGKFWEMHDKLFANQQALGAAEIEKYAGEIGLDIARWKASMEGPKGKARVEADKQLAAQFGASGTPTFFLNGRTLVGAQPFNAFKTVIDDEIKKADGLLAKGTPRARIYETILKDAKPPSAAP